MRKKPYDKKRVMESFAGAVRCLGPERIRFGYFRRMFRRDPDMVALVNRLQMAQYHGHQKKEWYNDRP